MEGSEDLCAPSVELKKILKSTFSWSKDILTDKVQKNYECQNALFKDQRSSIPTEMSSFNLPKCLGACYKAASAVSSVVSPFFSITLHIFYILIRNPEKSSINLYSA